jgi:hypothetical protein
LFNEEFPIVIQPSDSPRMGESVSPRLGNEFNKDTTSPKHLWHTTLESKTGLLCKIPKPGGKFAVSLAPCKIRGRWQKILGRPLPKS